ncbi:MAG: hypothetical protein ACRDV7_08335 [Acidimicrobiia bacterium]
MNEHAIEMALITGGGGFIGANIVVEGIEVVTGDVRDAEALSAIMRGSAR